MRGSGDRIDESKGAAANARCGRRKGQADVTALAGRQRAAIVGADCEISCYLTALDTDCGAARVRDSDSLWIRNYSNGRR